MSAAAPSSGESEETVRDRVMHEIGDYCGFDDDELYERGNNKRSKKRKE
jgi:predicted Zn-dependent protease with MMP-like domain